MTELDFTVPDQRDTVVTVAGPIDPATLGVTLMHEHIFVDLRRPAWARRPGEDAPEAAEPLTLANLAAVRHGRPNADNDLMADFDEMLPEVRAFAEAGGGTIVELSNLGLGRDPEALLRMSRATGLHLVTGAGWYTPTFHPADMDERSVEQLTEQIVRDVALGVGDTGIRCGIIGEVGAETNPLTANEWKSIRAAGRAGRITGAPISFHVGGVGEEKFDVLDVLLDEGVDPGGVVFGHAGDMALDRDFGRRMLERGVFIEFDFLAPPGSPWGALFLQSDHKTVEGLAALIDEGYGDRIVLGHDVCQKIQLARYGGKGYTYISRHFLPALRRLGVPEDAVSRLVIDNPARALAFRAPGDPSIT